MRAALGNAPGRRGHGPCAAAGLVLLVLPAACGSAPQPALVRTGDAVEITDRGEPFARYFVSPRRPVLWPLCAPGGVPVTRSFPFAEVEGEPRDHPHQESFWFAHGDLNGIDFWTGAGTVSLDGLQVDADAAAILGEGRWRGADGAEVCRDRHRLSFAAGEGWRAVDFDCTVTASAGPLHWGDTKEGTFGLRLRPEFTLQAGGHILTSEGLTDVGAWGRPARWVAYRAMLEGTEVVVAVFDHPGNHGHPTHWHARNYALVAANPFGLHDFTGAPPGSGDWLVPAGERLRFRYRVWIARGEGALAQVGHAYEEWVAEAGSGAVRWLVGVVGLSAPGGGCESAPRSPH